MSDMPVTPIIPAQIDEVGKGASFGPGSSPSGDAPDGSSSHATAIPSRGALLTIAAIIQNWLDWDASQRGRDGLQPSRNDRIVIPPTWPNRNQFEHWIKALKEAAEPSAFAAVNPSGETFDTIRQWSEETFGPVTNAIVAKRAAQEMDELLAEPDNVVEAADVVIVLLRYPGLWDAVQAKMAINRKRKWRLMGDGTGYHVKASASCDEHPQGEDPQGAESRSDASAVGEAETLKATPSIYPPPSPRKGQEENPRPMTVEEARDVLSDLDPDLSPSQAAERMRDIASWYRGSSAAQGFTELASRIELALSTIRASEEDR